jgi:hypothetical protein
MIPFVARIALVALSLGSQVGLATADGPAKLSVAPSCDAAARGAMEDFSESCFMQTSYTDNVIRHEARPAHRLRTDARPRVHRVGVQVLDGVDAGVSAPSGICGRYICGLRLRRTGVSQTAAAEVGNFPEADRT